MGKSSRLKAERRQIKEKGFCDRQIEEFLDRWELMNKPQKPDPSLPQLKMNEKTDWDSECWRNEYLYNPVPWQLMVHELEAIEYRIQEKYSVTPFQHGQLKLFRALVPAVTEGTPDNELLKEAGRMLWVSGGERDMYEAASIWTPKCCHRYIDLCWHGIGNWRS